MIRIDLTYGQLARFVEAAQQVIDDYAALDNMWLGMAIVEDDRGTLHIMTQPMYLPDDGNDEATEVVASVDALGKITIVRV